MTERIPVVILCGGMGTRLAEQTEVRPKPLVEIGGRPILWHIMKHYAFYGFNDFILALGYKGDQIKRYFLDFHAASADLEVSLDTGKVEPLGPANCAPWRVRLCDTGLETQTGGRLKRLERLLSNSTFMMTYGDGVSNVDLRRLITYHRENRALVTLTAVRPPARFGAVEIDGVRVRSFREKSALHEGWINGGFFVIEPEALQYVKGDVPWEREPLERIAEKGDLCAYRHDGFWQCMDTLRDLRLLQTLWEEGSPPWRVW